MSKNQSKAQNKISETTHGDIKETTRNLAERRLAIYLVCSFVLTWIWFAVTLPKGKTWNEMSADKQSLVALGMLFPAISHVLTRWITKEGFTMTGKNTADGTDSMMLGISFEKLKWIYYLVALVLPFLYVELGNIITIVIDSGCFDTNYYKMLGFDRKHMILVPISAIVTGTVLSFAAFGEEFGWRGYMMPKLFKLMPRIPALIIGGIIWGLWHMPLTVMGHDFGTDYPGYPWFGIVQMCFFCIIIGIILTFITEKSGSVWPATILHAVNNTMPSMLKLYINPEKTKRILGVNSSWSGLFISLLLTAFVILIIWKKESEKSINE